MSTHEDRIASLEQKVTDIELERLYERRKAAESTPSEQAYDAKQVNYRLTRLLGIASGQEHDIKAIRDEVYNLVGQSTIYTVSVWASGCTIHPSLRQHMP